MSHLNFKQFAPDRCQKVQDTLLGSRKLHIINEQGKQDEVRKYGSEIYNLCDTISGKQKLVDMWFGCVVDVATDS